MAVNLRYIVTKSGILKLVSVLLLLFCTILGSVGFDGSKRKLDFLEKVYRVRHHIIREKSLIVSSFAALVVSGLLLVASIVSHDVATSLPVLLADGVYHILMAIVLLITGSLMVYSVVETDGNTCANIPMNEMVFVNKGDCREQLKFFEKVTSGALGIVVSTIFAVIGVLVLSSLWKTWQNKLKNDDKGAYSAVMRKDIPY